VNSSQVARGWGEEQGEREHEVGRGGNTTTRRREEEMIRKRMRREDGILL
jgi:hypothetical protein